MSFLAPLALVGLLTIPAILLLHLLRNRRERLDIPSLRIWRGLEQKKQGRMPRHIPLSLMLLLQLLAAAALSLGLARPALSFLLAKPRQTIFILDMTTSMAAEDALSVAGNQGPVRRFDVARRFIRTQLQEMGRQDSFSVIGLEPQPRVLLTGEGQQKAQALLALDNLIPGATGLDLPAAFTLANGLIDNTDRQPQIVVVTDGNFFVESEALPAMLAPVTWQIIPAPSAGSSNQALLNVSAKRLPDGRHRIFARIINYGDSPVDRTLQLSTDQTIFDELTVRLDPQEEADRVWTVPESVQTVTVEIVETDLLPLDNRAELLLIDTARYRVLLLSTTPKPLGQEAETDPLDSPLARALTAQPGVELTLDEPTAPRHDPADFDLVLFEGLSSDLTAWPRGNLLVVNPPLGHPLLPAERFMRNVRPASAVESAIAPESSSVLLAGVDLSGVYFNRVPHLTLPDWAELDLLGLSLTNEQEPAGSADTGQPLIFHGTVGNSRLVVWAFDLAASNLPARLALPILTANTVSTLLAPSPPPVSLVGQPVPIQGDFTVEIPGGRRLSSFASSEREPDLFSRTKQPGLYRIYDDRDRLVAGFAIHAGSARESNLAAPFHPHDLMITYVSETASPDLETDYQEFWPWLAGLALAVVIGEGWLAWRR